VAEIGDWWRCFPEADKRATGARSSGMGAPFIGVRLKGGKMAVRRADAHARDQASWRAPVALDTVDRACRGWLTMGGWL
jgi:hypothetical protein